MSGMPPTLLLNPSRLRLDLRRVDGSAITVVMAATPTSSSCPLCGLSSSRVHSRWVGAFSNGPDIVTTVLPASRHRYPQFEAETGNLLMPAAHTFTSDEMPRCRRSSHSAQSPPW